MGAVERFATVILKFDNISSFAHTGAEGIADFDAESGGEVVPICTENTLSGSNKPDEKEHGCAGN